MDCHASLFVCQTNNFILSSLDYANADINSYEDPIRLYKILYPPAKVHESKRPYPQCDKSYRNSPF